VNTAQLGCRQEGTTFLFSQREIRVSNVLQLALTFTLALAPPLALRTLHRGSAVPASLTWREEALIPVRFLTLSAGRGYLAATVSCRQSGSNNY